MHLPPAREAGTDHADEAGSPPAAEVWSVDQKQLARLDRLQEIGMDLAESLRRRAVGETTVEETDAAAEPVPEAAVPELCLAFDRLTRAIRQLMILERECAGLRPPPGVRIVAGVAGEPAPPKIAQFDWKRSDRALLQAERLAAPGPVHDERDELALFDALPYEGALAHIRRSLNLAEKASARQRFDLLAKLGEELTELTSDDELRLWERLNPEEASEEIEELTADELAPIGSFVARAKHLLRPDPPPLASPTVARGTGPP